MGVGGGGAGAGAASGGAAERKERRASDTEETAECSLPSGTGSKAQGIGIRDASLGGAGEGGGGRGGKGFNHAVGDVGAGAASQPPSLASSPPALDPAASDYTAKRLAKGAL